MQCSRFQGHVERRCKCEDKDKDCRSHGLGSRVRALRSSPVHMLGQGHRHGLESRVRGSGEDVSVTLRDVLSVKIRIRLRMVAAAGRCCSERSGRAPSTC